MFKYSTRMSLWDLYNETFNNFENNLDDFEKDFFDNDFMRISDKISNSYPKFPPANIFITIDKTLVFEFAIAGHKKDDIDLSISGDYLSLSLKGKNETKTEENQKNRFLKKGIKINNCQSKYLIPSDKYLLDEISASFNNGILRIKIPAKKSVKKSYKKINIKS